MLSEREEYRVKTQIYLASLSNTGFGLNPATVPLQLGYIKAYAQSVLKDEINIRMFITVESLLQSIERQKPAIIGCSWYGWNIYLTANALQYIKKKYPSILTVVGGAGAPEKETGCLRDFALFQGIDAIIPNEGEVPFVNLVKQFLSGGAESFRGTQVDGVFYYDRKKKRIIAGRPLEKTKDLNICPSPYLQGDLNEFLSMDLMPMIQTSRGCPYGCKFCVSGRLSWSKLRLFPSERVKQEIQYIEQHALSRELRFTDENFGIHPRDEEIAAYLAELRRGKGFPTALRMYTDKHINNRIKNITLMLKDLIPMNISCQTLTPEVQANLGRANISIEKFSEAAQWAHSNNINITTEAIFGLPGESKRSFLDVVNTFIELRLDSSVLGALLMLKETELNSAETIRKYSYRTMYSVAERGYTKYNDFESVEIDPWAVASSSFTFDEYIEMHEFTFVFNFLMTRGFFKEMAYSWDNRGVKIGEVILELIGHPQQYPFVADKIKRLHSCLLDNLFDTPEEVHMDFVRKHSSARKDVYIGYMSPYILTCILEGEMIHSENQQIMIDEITQAAMLVFSRNGTGDDKEFSDEMDFLRQLVRQVIVPFWQKGQPEEKIYLDSPYDLVSWRAKDYRGTLSQYACKQPKKLVLKINSLEPYVQFIEKHAQEPYYLQAEFFFRNFRTNNIRRHIETM